MITKMNRSLLLLMSILSLLVFAVSGCGDDDDPTTPTPIGGDTDQFDQTTAVAQAQVAAPQGVALVESMTGLAGGFGKADKDYAYNEANQRWEYHYEYSQTGYVYDWFYTVQYLNGSGQPQREATGAASIRHTLAGTMEYGMDQGGVVFDYDYLYDYDTTLTGLGTDTLVMTGTGGFDLDYTYSTGGINQNYEYLLEWETLGAGISYPEAGCPQGTIRYTLTPYHLDLVFNGSTTAVATLYDGSGNVVAAGGGNYPLSCSK